MRRVGLTGGIGAGKSAVGALLATHGAHVIDADEVARAVVAPGSEGLAEVVAAFGDGVLAADGSLDRPALGAIVFADAAARRILEAITHPRIGAETQRRVGLLADDTVLVHEIPLLAENGLGAGFDAVVVVEAPLDVRLARLAARGLPPDQAKERMAAQASDAQRRAIATVLIDNGGDKADLAAAVDAAWPRIAGRTDTD